MYESPPLGRARQCGFGGWGVTDHLKKSKPHEVDRLQDDLKDISKGC